MKVYIWGTGVMAKDYLDKQEIARDDILGFIESSRTKTSFEGKKVYEPQEILGEYDYILVCVRNKGGEICHLCEQTGISKDKLILLDNWEWLDGKPLDELPPGCCRKIVENEINVRKIFPRFYESYVEEQEIRANRYITISRNGFDLREENAPMISEEFNTIEYQLDYVRYRTFELVANEIIRNEIKGSVAEVGVYRGTFAKLINIKFKDKKIYLFDTFESFNVSEFNQELKAGRVPQRLLGQFKNTSVQEVIGNMDYPDKCVIKKGLFPDTADDLDQEEYAFVSIDVDLEKSILEALRYFYPRLNHGGFIFVHDYNNRFLEGVKNAVSIYEDEQGMRLLKVPLADEGGTLVIVK